MVIIVVVVVVVEVGSTTTVAADRLRRMRGVNAVLAQTEKEITTNRNMVECAVFTR